MNTQTPDTRTNFDMNSGAIVLQAFLECSPELQEHAKKMLAAMLDSSADHDDREAAGITLADILFPNTHEGDKMLGLDLLEAEKMARQNPESNQVLSVMDEEESFFASRLAKIMTDQNVTQVELASRIGVGQPAISMMLARSCRPQKRTIAKLAEALGVTSADLWPSFSEK